MLAKKLLPLRKKGLQLLVTILFGCAVTNSGISILLAEAEGNISGFFISTALTLILGEILPQAVSNRYPLQIGAYTRYLLYFFYYAMFIVAFPVSAIIGKILGDGESTLLSKSRMKRMFEMYEKQQMLNSDERKILQAALDLKSKTLKDVMTPIG